MSAFGYSSQNKHFHDRLSFAIVTEGEGEFRFKYGYRKASVGSIIKIAPREVHSSGKSIDQNHFKYRVFYLTNSSIQHILNAEEYKADNEISFKEQISFDENLFFRSLLAHKNLDRKTDPLYRETIFTNLILTLLGNHTYTKTKLPIIDSRPSYLSTIIEYLQAYYRKPISLEQLSIIARRSPSQIIRTFQKHIGVAPHVYLTNLRVIKAKELLSQNLSISQAAFEVGFNDQSHLHRYFKRINHVTPGKFKRSILA